MNEPFSPDTKTSPPTHRAWLIGAAVLYVGLLMVSPWADGPLAKALKSEPLPGDLEKLILLAEVFAHGLGVAVILLAVKSLDPRGWRVIPRLATTAYLSGMAANFVKMLVIRRRPNQLEEIPDSMLGSFEGWLAPLTVPWDEAFEYATQSFPSAHTATAFGLAVGLSRLYPRGTRLFFTLAVLAGLQRMVVQAHFFSDVVVGGGIGATTAHLLQRPGAWSEQLWARWERGGQEESLSDRPQVDTLAEADGGNVQRPRRGTDVGFTTLDHEHRRAG